MVSTGEPDHAEQHRPHLLFVCVKNGGKSQLAAGLMRHLAGDTVEVSSAGTKAGATINPLSAASLAEIGIDISQEKPTQLTDDAVRSADLVVTLGSEAKVDPVEGIRFENWEVDEPSDRGIEGMERMRLVRDDIARQVRQLAVSLDVAPD
jgi:arsenate-mycothiol transferase